MKLKIIDVNNKEIVLEAGEDNASCDSCGKKLVLGDQAYFFNINNRVYCFDCLSNNNRSGDSDLISFRNGNAMYYKGVITKKEVTGGDC